MELVTKEMQERLAAVLARHEPGNDRIYYGSAHILISNLAGEVARMVADERERIAQQVEAMSSPYAGDPFKVRADAARLVREGMPT